MTSRTVILVKENQLYFTGSLNTTVCVRSKSARMKAKPLTALQTLREAVTKIDTDLSPDQACCRGKAHELILVFPLRGSSSIMEKDIGG